MALCFGCNGRAKETAAASFPAVKTAATGEGEYWSLPPPTTAGGMPLYDALAGRRSYRSYANRRLTEYEMGQLLWAAQGVTDARGFRTAPSAGALYPLEILWVDDEGVWVYVPGRHALRRVTAEDRRPALAAAALGQAPVKRAAAVMVIVANPSVTAVKYGSRAERYCTLEAGHAAQNVLLTATALSLSACPVGAFRDAEVLAAVGLGDNYLPLYLITLGPAFRP